ncbi:hypothetical protein ElyMa_002149800 [Elysia marginata]|uniref:Uncharacterized protein n=1 Tax=Elysia marginata TaxID=1093978 RepID=A0AAV4FKW7_9GAST|nr:hypothetical protein ElyMa_002149800 [Elysia marginata]
MDWADGSGRQTGQSRDRKDDKIHTVIQPHLAVSEADVIASVVGDRIQSGGGHRDGIHLQRPGNVVTRAVRLASS